MSRGGRRRKSRRAGPSAAKSQPPQAADAVGGEGRTGAAHSKTVVEGSVVEKMRTHAKRLQTMPPDDLVLDDLIAGLQSEYGIPPTPQEYRLVIRTPSAEPEAPAEPSTQAAQEVSDATPPEGTPISTTSRRRRRRRSTSGLTHDEADGEPHQSEDDESDT